MKNSKLAAGLLAAWLLGGASASNASAAEADSPCATPVPVAAKYRVTLTKSGTAPKRSQEWLFVRSAGQVAVTKPGVSEVWRCEGASGVSLERVFHADRRVAEYSAGELRALHVAPSWSTLATMFDERRLPGLHPAGTQRVGSNTLLRYRGVVDGERIDLVWDPVARLPARMARTKGRESAVFERLESHATAPAEWPVAGVVDADYLRVDAADFGDMEYDAFVRKAEARDLVPGWRPSAGSSS